MARLSFSLVQLGLFWFISLFEKNGGENIGAEKMYEKDLAGKRNSGENTKREKIGGEKTGGEKTWHRFYRT